MGFPHSPTRTHTHAMASNHDVSGANAWVDSYLEALVRVVWRRGRGWCVWGATNESTRVARCGLCVGGPGTRTPALSQQSPRRGAHALTLNAGRATGTQSGRVRAGRRRFFIDMRTRARPLLLRPCLLTPSSLPSPSSPPVCPPSTLARAPPAATATAAAVPPAPVPRPRSTRTRRSTQNIM